MDEDIYLVGGKVIDFLYLNLALVLGFEDGINYHMGSFSIWYFLDSQSVLVNFLDFCPNLHDSSPLTFHIF